ncbi:MAG TPA: 2-phosphosulfolactate phosphatase, partial [Elusimicrobiales bacterium]|nr:2-phosphosulfolactate phosphatase [Elusimicrobiales bacterium]
IYSDEEKALRFWEKNGDYDIFSEKDLKIEKFDNSPHLALTEETKDNLIVLTNSGSKAVMASAKAEKIIIASLCNISALKKYLIKSSEDVMVVPACIFFDQKHVEDFLVSRFIKDYIITGLGDVDELIKKIDEAGRIKELKKLRKTADKDIEIIFSIDKFKTLPIAKLKGDFAEVMNESDN